MRLKDLTGKRYGRIVVKSIFETNKKHIYWNCICDCGTEKIIRSDHLTRGIIVSCGCYQKEMVKKVCKQRAKHGLSKCRLYKIWLDIKTRCYNKKSENYKYYGLKNILMCKEWKNDFYEFYKWAIENGYNENASYGECTIDRIDVNGNYEPFNCRWVNLIEQANNKTTNHFIDFNGERKTIAQWSSIKGIPKSVLFNRINRLKWDIEKALTKPIDKTYSHKRTGVTK